MMRHLPHTVGALMTDSPATVDPDDRLDCADSMFTLAESRHLPVVRGGKLVGVLSLRDMLAAERPAWRTSIDAQIEHLHEIRVGSVMQKKVLTATPEESVVSAVGRLLAAGISCLPVLLREELVGIVTTSDFVRLAADHLVVHAEELGEPLSVSQLMSSHPTAVHPDDRVNLAELLMRFGHFHHLPVLEGNRLVGIVTDRDILAALRSDREPLPAAEKLLDRASLRVGDIMTPHPDTVTPRTEAAVAAGMLLAHGYGALPIVSNEALVGIITERDFLRYLVDRLSSSVTSSASAFSSST
jgi:acetoin utilization protein AcuB